VETAVSVKPAYGLNDDAITRMLQDSQQHAREDAEARALRELQIDGQRLIDATRSALDEDGAALLNDAELAQIEQLLTSLATVLQGTNRDAIRTASEQLNQGTTEFAARRMNHNIQHALAGRKLAELSQ
jgi:molecular chaperone HscA